MGKGAKFIDFLHGRKSDEKWGKLRSNKINSGDAQIYFRNIYYLVRTCTGKGVKGAKIIYSFFFKINSRNIRINFWSSLFIHRKILSKLIN